MRVALTSAAVVAVTLVSTVAFGRAGRVVLVQGDATVQSDADPAAIARGQDLNEGDTIVTGSDGRVRMLMKDRSLMVLGPGSKMTLKAYVAKRAERKVSLSVFVGKLWARVTKAVGKSKYEIETTNAVAGVRGTEVVVETDGETTDVTVIEGLVDVTTPDGTTEQVGDNQQGSAGGEGGIEVTNVDLSENNPADGIHPEPQVDESQEDGLTAVVPEPEPDQQGPAEGVIVEGVEPEPDEPPLILEPGQSVSNIRGRIEVRE